MTFSVPFWKSTSKIIRYVQWIDAIIIEMKEKIFEEEPVITPSDPDTSLSEVFPASAKLHVPKL